MDVMTDVAVIGAGPYGLSLAAHLRARGADIRVFGFPMQSWRDSMPVGMKLKSEGFASNISDPNGALSLGTFCREMNIPYADTNLLVSLDTFVSYGEAFQKRFVPDLEKPSRNAAACGIETVVLYPGCGRERPSTFWWRVTP